MNVKKTTLANQTEREIDIDLLIANLKVKSAELDSNSEDVGYDYNSYSRSPLKSCPNIDMDYLRGML